MKIEVDRGNDVLYIELHEDVEVDRTVDLSDGVLADLDAAGDLVGIEAISLAAFETFLEARDLPTDIVTWLHDETDLLRMLDLERRPGA